MPENDDLIQRTLFALESLMRMFSLERMLYLFCALISFGLLLFVIASLFIAGSIGTPQLMMIFGASGLIAASAARVSFFLNRSFDLIDAIIRQLATMQGPRP